MTLMMIAAREEIKESNAFHRQKRLMEEVARARAVDHRPHITLHRDIFSDLYIYIK